MKPLVSIIIPTYNRAHLIIETLDSIIAQTYTNWECIVVDDGSTDITLDILEAYVKKDNRFQYHIRPSIRIKGANTCRNYGFELSKGEYVNWFDSDDLMHVDFLKLKKEKILSGNYDFVSCELSTLSNNKIVPLKYNYDANILESYFCGELAFYTPGPLYKKSFILENNLTFDNKSKVLNDWIFCLKVLFQTTNFFLIKKPLCYYRVHDKSISVTLSDLDSNFIFSEFETRLEFYKEFSQKKIITKKINDFYFKRIVFLLRSLLLKKDKRALKVFIYLLTFEFRLLSKLKISIGFFLFTIFNKGYKYLK